MTEYEKIRNKKRAETVIKGLESRNMEAFYAETKEEALKQAMDLIPTGASVSWGGTMSAAAIGLLDAVKKGDYTVYDRSGASSPEEKREIELKAYGCDFYFSSANAVSEDGELVNIDGFANRVSAIAAGPKNVLLIVGMNKVVRNLSDAMSRAKNEAAPINAQRFNIQTPCTKTGVCFDCKVPDTICCQTLITRYSKIAGRIKVILVNEELGF